MFAYLHGSPVLLIKRAQEKRKAHNDDRWWAPMERNKPTLSQRVQRVAARPFVILFSEPMLMAITLYMSVSFTSSLISPKSSLIDSNTVQFVYGVIYLLFEAIPIVFADGHHFNEGFVGLTFLPIFIGGALGAVLYLVVFDPRYEAAIVEYYPEPVPPEYRLEPCLYAALIYALSFFWFGWTSFPSVSFWAPVAAIVPMSLAVILIFLGLLNYVIDAYLFAAASALSAATVCRSVFGTVFPLFSTQMYDRLGPQWASTLLGFIALIMAPIPFLLTRYGPALRRRSRYAPTEKGATEKV